MERALKIAFCIALPLGIGGLSGFLTASEISGWYETLQKPSFNPPNYIFGPVWTALYLLMGISLLMVWNTGTTARKRKALLAFVIQLTLNFLWSILFFRMHRVDLALADIVLLWIAILSMMVYFYGVRKIAAFLQIPYLLWVTFATALNTAILLLN